MQVNQAQFTGAASRTMRQTPQQQQTGVGDAMRLGKSGRHQAACWCIVPLVRKRWPWTTARVIAASGADADALSDADLSGARPGAMPTRAMASRI